MPIPFKPSKNMKDKMQPIVIKVISKAIFIVPNFIFGFLMAMARASARTTPSPGTTITLGATSMQMPTAKMKQPTKRESSFSRNVSGWRKYSQPMLTSIK